MEPNRWNLAMIIDDLQPTTEHLLSVYRPRHRSRVLQLLVQLRREHWIKLVEGRWWLNRPTYRELAQKEADAIEDMHEACGRCQAWGRLGGCEYGWLYEQGFKPRTPWNCPMRGMLGGPRRRAVEAEGKR